MIDKFEGYRFDQITPWKEKQDAAVPSTTPASLINLHLPLLLKFPLYQVHLISVTKINEPRAGPPSFLRIRFRPVQVVGVNKLSPGRRRSLRGAQVRDVFLPDRKQAFALLGILGLFGDLPDAETKVVTVRCRGRLGIGGLFFHPRIGVVVVGGGRGGESPETAQAGSFLIVQEKSILCQCLGEGQWVDGLVVDESELFNR
jgi:hypothetical protein